jgi:hypothetical protein
MILSRFFSFFLRFAEFVCAAVRSPLPLPATPN